MANVQTNAEQNVIDKAKVARVRELDFATMFGENINSLVTMLGVTRKIPVTAGTVLKKLTVTGTLASGDVAEGEIIPLSQYNTEWTPVGEVTLKKYRKATTAEAIMKGGYDQAVNDTNARMVLDIQKNIRTDLIEDLETEAGTDVEGDTLQATIAKIWGKLQVKFEDDSIQSVYFVNPLDVADYLAKAEVTVQTAFGFTYIENFLGMGNVIMSALIDKGTILATASENIVCNYVNANEANGLGDAFEFTVDPETGFVGIHEEANYARMQSETVAVAGVKFFAEQPAGVVSGEIKDLSAD